MDFNHLGPAQVCASSLVNQRVFTRLGHELRQYSVIGALKIFYIYGFLSLPWNTGLGTVRDQKMNAGFGRLRRASDWLKRVTW